MKILLICILCVLIGCKSADTPEVAEGAQWVEDLIKKGGDSEHIPCKHNPAIQLGPGHYKCIRKSKDIFTTGNTKWSDIIESCCGRRSR